MKVARQSFSEDGQFWPSFAVAAIAPNSNQRWNRGIHNFILI
jgi:hypothetical protein